MSEKDTIVLEEVEYRLYEEVGKPGKRYDLAHYATLALVYRQLWIQKR
jgi:hypothetical protein